jgi:hypothetical protein
MHWVCPFFCVHLITCSSDLQLGAGFGRGGTSLPFWENVYGFDMSCIGKEVTASSARFPLVDILPSQDIVTDTAVLHVSLSNLKTYSVKSFVLRCPSQSRYL